MYLCIYFIINHLFEIAQKTDYTQNLISNGVFRILEGEQVLRRSRRRRCRGVGAGGIF